MTRGQLKTALKTNLADQGLTFYSEEDLNESIQDAYDDIAALTQCILRVKYAIPFQSDLNYYDFSQLGVPDYMGVTAVFNNVTNRWLMDDVSLRDLDNIRRDWENWYGSAMYWVPSDPKHVVLVPKLLGNTATGAFEPFSFSSAFFIGSGSGLGTFDLFYWAVAPAVTSDSYVFEIASDQTELLEFYVTADMLEQAQEFTKATTFWNKYYPGVQDYAKRVKSLNKSDLLMRV